MKVALISFEFWYNYGTCLQAFALQEAVQRLGVDVEYFDPGWRYPMSPIGQLLSCVHYKRSRISNYHRLGACYIVLRDILRKRSLVPLKCLRVVSSNSEAFDTFRSSWLRISLDTNLESVNSRYDVFVVGSDQTWNPHCVSEAHFARFLLDFVEDNDKKVSYAPSVGMTTIDKKTKGLFARYLTSFKSLSCRERRGAALISGATGRDVTPVLDPTFLLTPVEWRRVAKPLKVPRAYVLCYLLGGKTCVLSYARRLAEERGVELIVLSSNEHIVEQCPKSIVSGVGPSEFVYLIDHAEEVVTDSFHGTAFAVNFNKPMHSFMKRSGDVSVSDNSRISDLLAMFKLSERFIADDAELYLSTCDFTDANLVLKLERKKSLEYLKSALGVWEKLV